ncbi:hypothetical protein TNCV_172911 [Trichonephila clavipes]|nr:hypothetical protein TNCV_172911 [Trichonephila clavipes]
MNCKIPSGEAENIKPPPPLQSITAPLHDIYSVAPSFELVTRQCQPRDRDHDHLAIEATWDELGRSVSIPHPPPEDTAEFNTILSAKGRIWSHK